MENFKVYPVPLPLGTLAISPMPGRGGDFDADFAILRAWQPDLVLTMITPQELHNANAIDFGEQLHQAGIIWLHLPIKDFGPPQGQTATDWPKVSTQARAILAQGGRVLAHCWGGNGRSGMAALRLMVEMGGEPVAALAELRKVRGGAVETDAQMAWAVGNIKI